MYTALHKRLVGSALLILLLYVALFVPVGRISARVDGLGLAIPTQLNEAAEGGSIVCATAGGLEMCRVEYDPGIYGVVVSRPTMAIESSDLEDMPKVLQRGEALVRVSTVNGAIEPGDLITSSTIPGVGQKATVNGFVLGVAMEQYSSSDPDDIGTILVALNIHPSSAFVGSRSNLIANFRQALSAPVVTPLDSLRYLLAFIVAIISFALGFVYFGRVVRTGIEAIGRNPLASRMIQITILVNIVITIVVVLTGLAIAFLILII